MNKLLEKAKAVIFDVDGLMIDSEPLWHRARVVFFDKKRVEYVRKFDPKGRGIRNIVTLWKKHFGLEGTTDELANEFRSVFYELALSAQQLTLMLGTAELVQKLFNEGKVLGIATGGHSQEKMLQILQLFHLDHYFSAIVSSDEVANGKPAPDIFLRTAEKLGFAPKDCVVLEDAPNGVEAAKAANIPVIAVQTDEETIKRLTQLQPDLLVESLTQLI